MADVAGWVTIGFYATAVMVAVARQVVAWVAGWFTYSRDKVLWEDGTLNQQRMTWTAYCTEHYREKTRSGKPPAARPDLSVRPRAAESRRWSYAPSPKSRIGVVRWVLLCAGLAVTRRFAEPGIGVCWDCHEIEVARPE